MTTRSLYILNPAMIVHHKSSMTPVADSPYNGFSVSEGYERL
ncbi:MAG: hypothetical protein H6Q07_2531 [Acidobacteria bacterium]|nr:hypothetical protein [Acidobacteriota bacterium]